MKSGKLIATVVAVAGAALSASAQDVLFDAGPVCTSLNVSTGTPTLLGLSSGSLPSASLPQRWCASPFTLSAAATVTELNVYGFDPEDTGQTGTLFFSNIKYIIWNRTAFNVPTTQAASGTVSTAVIGPGVADPRSGYANLMVFKLLVNHALPAGNYYLTVYADGASATGNGDANFAWFTNAQLNVALTPPNTPIVMTDANGMYGWRSVSQPTPGFARYTLAPTAWLPDPAPVAGPNPQDPQYMLNNAFYISGTAGGPVCYANCDGSTVPPILNVSDFICFQTKYAAGDSYANCDGSTIPPVLNVSDFICFQTKYSAGCI